MTQNQAATNNLNSTGNGSLSASSTPSATDTTTFTPGSNFLSPYNSNNFMAPPIGAHIRCVTCLGNSVQGKVIAYDQQTKMLALSKRINTGFMNQILKNFGIFI